MRSNLMPRQQIREIAGKLMEAWQNIDAVAEVLGCHRKNIRQWHAEYIQKSADGHGSTQVPGRPPKLSDNQQHIIQDIIFTKTPKDVGHSDVLWSNIAVRAVIQDLFKTNLSLGTINTMIRKMGIIRTNILKSNPVHRKGNRERWLNHRLPFIRKLAQDRNARILFIHNTEISFLPPPNQNGRGSSPSEDPDSGTSNLRRQMISAVCFRNSQRFMLFSEPFGTQPFITFLKGLIHDIDRPLFLIAEPHFKTKSCDANHFLSSTAERLQIFFLPDNDDILTSLKKP